MPMMYMDDAIAATIKSCKRLRRNKKLDLQFAMSFTPTEIAEIKKHIPEFTITYEPDLSENSRWPASIDDAEARKDWNWKHEFDLES
jgi:nucleoside-diphosphate-sugar epimerase